MDTHLIAPGSTTTSATDTAVDMLKCVESAILMLPPDRRVGSIWEKWYANGEGT